MHKSPDIEKWSSKKLYEFIGIQSGSADARTIDARTDHLIVAARARGDKERAILLEKVRNRLVLSLSTESQSRIKTLGRPGSAPSRVGIAYTPVYDVPYVPGKANNIQRHTQSKIIFIDSSDRPQLSESSTSFQYFLETPIKNIVRLSLESISIPSRIVNISPSLGNSYFKLGEDKTIRTIPTGSYDLTTEKGVDSLSMAMFGSTQADAIPYIQQAAAAPVSAIRYLSVSESTGRLVLAEVSLDPPPSIVWLDDDIIAEADKYFSSVNISSKTSFHYQNNTPTVYNNLGVVLGFTPKYQPATSESIGTHAHISNGQVVSVVTYLSDVDNDTAVPTPGDHARVGAKSSLSQLPPLRAQAVYTLCANSLPSLQVGNYIFLAIDDYQHAQASDAIAKNRREREDASLPSYYTKALFKTSKKSFDPKSSEETAVPMKPRSLTQAQLYTVNAINSSNGQPSRMPAKKNAHTLAMIPIGDRNESGGHRMAFCRDRFTPVDREYFGPAKIGKLNVTLTNEKGAVLSLDGQDWSCVLKAETLYQY